MLGGREGGITAPVAAGAAALVLLSCLTLALAGQAAAQPRARLVFDSQTSNGTVVEIEHVNSTHGGFIVLYEEAFITGEVFESLRGASSYVEPGPHRNVTAHLDEPLTRNQTMVAVFHMDTNGNRSLDVIETRGGEDGPYQGATGAVFDMADVTVEPEKRSPAIGPVAPLLVTVAVAGGLAGARASPSDGRRRQR